MSQKRVCDKCEKILKCNPAAKIRIDYGYQGIVEFELCSECKDKLTVWLSHDK